MAEIDNKITITLPAFDMMSMVAMLEVIFEQIGYPDEQMRISFTKFKIQVLINASTEALDDVMAELMAHKLIKDVFKN